MREPLNRADDRIVRNTAVLLLNRLSHQLREVLAFVYLWIRIRSRCHQHLHNVRIPTRVA